MRGQDQTIRLKGQHGTMQQWRIAQTKPARFDPRQHGDIPEYRTSIDQFRPRRGGERARSQVEAAQVDCGGCAGAYPDEVYRVLMKLSEVRHAAQRALLDSEKIEVLLGIMGYRPPDSPREASE